MAEYTKIEWTTHTFNPVRGCCKVSAGCANCYALTLSKRNPTVLGIWGPSGTRVLASEAMWAKPLEWNRAAQASGMRPKVFCASLADVFEDASTCQRPDAYQAVETARARLWLLIEATPHLVWQLLTKRPQNIMDMVPGAWRKAWPANVWIGTSVEDQAAADTRLPQLLRVPAPVRFASCEPLLGPVNLRWVREAKSGHVLDVLAGRYGTEGSGPNLSFSFGLCSYQPLDWVIAGGESGAGPRVRPMHPQWARDLRDQCAATGKPFLFKQSGEWVEVGESDAKPGDAYLIRRGLAGNEHNADFWRLYPWESQDPPMRGAEKGRWSPYYDALLRRVGKASAGRVLDGQEWNQMPEVAPL